MDKRRCAPLHLEVTQMLLGSGANTEAKDTVMGGGGGEGRRYACGGGQMHERIFLLIPGIPADERFGESCTR